MPNLSPCLHPEFLKERGNGVDVQYRLIYEDNKNVITITRFCSGEYMLEGATPEMADRLGSMFDIDKAFKVF